MGLLLLRGGVESALGTQVGGHLGRSSVLFVAVTVVFALLPAWAAHAATLTVNSTGDAADANTGDGFCDAVGGGCTLRAAIQQANAVAGADTIEFLIDSGAQTISPSSALPAITEAVTIDGTTQPGWVDVPIITVSGASAGVSASGLIVSAGPTTIRGLVVGGFAATGILLQSGINHVLEGNHIGTNSAGVSRHANGTGVNIMAASTGNTIGGTGAGEGNLIAGNSNNGLTISSNGNLIVGNRIGGVGTFTPSNNGNGVSIQNASNNVIGGTAAAARNIISGNGGSGVVINGATATQNVVLGNYLGLTETGTSVYRSNGSGVHVTGGSNNTVGGTAPGARNVITGNDTAGVTIEGTSATGNLVQGNYIGTNASGGSSFDSSWDRALRGVRIQNSSGNVIGGTSAAARNVISLNQQGISLWGTGGPTENNRIEGNYIGTDPTGTIDQGNFGAGVSLLAAASNVIGGTNAGAGNVIAGNDSTNVFIEGTAGTRNRIQGNIIGLNAAGTGALTNGTGSAPNGFGGISVRSAGTVVGGTVAAARNIISGHPQHGIEVSAPDVSVKGNYIGTDINGTNDFGNESRGVYVLSAGGQTPAGSVIGGASPAARNVIAGNGNGVDLSSASSGVTVSGNYIGLDVNGSPLGNSSGVVSFSAGANTIGGDAPGEGNVISGNTTYGLFVGDTSGLTVQGNLIGTNPAGTTSIGGHVYGISGGNGTTDATIGGTTPGAGNVIAGAQVGVSFQGTGSGNVVQGNFIGTDRTRTLDLGNSDDGLRVAMSGTQIGGDAAGAGNVIARNDGAGILLWNGATGMRTRGNSIFDNGTAAVPELGIDNGTSTVRPEPNDAGDGDSGTNLRQNYPVLTSATSTSGTTTVAGTLNSAASTTFAIDVFATPACDVMGNGEGQHYLGSFSTTTDGTGNAAFNAPVTGYAPGGWAVTTTATDPNGNSSEFSACQTASGAPGATVDDVDITEGNSGSAIAEFTVTLTDAPGQEATIAFTTVDATATDPGDYTTASGTLVFGPTETSKTISVPVHGDTLSELDEQFTLSLSSPSGVGLLDEAATGTILSDDPPSITVDDIVVDEGNTGTTAGAFTIALSRPVEFAVSVDYQTTHGTAGTDDYSTTTGTATIQPGETSIPVDVSVTGDTLDELDETFTVGLSDASGGSIVDGTGTATIADDDAPPALVISNAAVTEGNSGASNAVFTITASAPSAKAITVDVDTADNTATQPADYQTVSTTATIAAGQTTATVNVPVVGDTADETSQETFHVNLTAPVNATIGDGQGVGTITDNDPAPTLSVSDGSETEGNAGTTVMTFDVNLSTASGQQVRVSYNTPANTATAGTDYTAVSGQLIFEAGQTTKTVDVTIHGDELDEANETFNFNLGSPTNATISDSTGLGTIIDDDTPPAVSIGDATIAEQAGDLNFTLTLSRTYPQAVSVQYATANATATANQDYTGESGTVTFPAGTSQQQISITVLNDDVSEGTETFQVNLSSPGGGLTIADAQAIGTITDAADVPSVSINDVAASESGNMSFTATLNRMSTSPITVTAATSNSTAAAPDDFTAKQEVLTFTPGTTSRPFVVTVVDDPRDENDETFGVGLSSPSSNVTIGDGSGTGTINDNDEPPTLTVNNVGVTEAAGDSALNFTVTASGASGKTISFDAATTSGTAQSPDDFTAFSDDVVIPAGTTSVQVPITIKADVLDEDVETFTLTLSNLSNAQAAGSDLSGEGTITDNDDPPVVSVADAATTEDAADGTTLTFLVSLSAPSGQQVTVDYQTVDGTADASDYTAASGELTFTPGQTAKSVDITVADDGLHEPGADETVLLQLATPTNATPGDSQAMGTIDDDDLEPAVSIDDATVTEGSSGTTPATFELTLSGPSSQTITVPVQTGNDPTPGAFAATASTDFTPLPDTETVTFEPGDVSQEIDVAVAGDTTPERDETFAVLLGSPSGATAADGSGIGTIQDDDAPDVSISDATVAETGDAEAVFTVTLSDPPGKTVTVNYSTYQLDTADGAVADEDYAAQSGTLTFEPGDVANTVEVPITNDNAAERTEFFEVRLSQPTNALISDGTATGTITDAGDRPRVFVDDITVDENTAGGVASFELELTHPSAETITVDFGVAENTALDPQDFAVTSGTVTFLPGELTQSVDVDVVNDADHELDETFDLTLSDPSHAILGSSGAVATIVSDDGPPTVSIGNASVTELDTDSVVAVFPVQLSSRSFDTITLNFATAPGSAGAPADFTAKSGALTFAPGERTKNIRVAVRGDLLDEIDERFAVNLSALSAGTFADATGRATIVDDDPLPSLAVGNTSVTEGNTGSKLAAFTLRLNRPSGRAVKVNWRTVEDTAKAPSDYVSKSGDFTFSPGQTVKTINVKVLGDTRNEADERFKVVLSNRVNATFADATAYGKIIDND